MQKSVIKGAGVFSGGNPFEANVPYQETSTYQLFKNIYNSPYRTVTIWGLHINESADIQVNDCVVASQGVFNPMAEEWALQVKNLKRNGTINRIEVSILNDWETIATIVDGSQPALLSTFVDNFNVLMEKIDFDAINTDNESGNETDAEMNNNFVKNVCIPIEAKYTLCPYNNREEWVDLTIQLNGDYPGIVDAVFLQCYDGGRSNDPGVWNEAFSSTGLLVSPGLWASHYLDSNSQTCSTSTNNNGKGSWDPEEVAEQINTWKTSGSVVESAWMYCGTDMQDCPAKGDAEINTIGQYALAIIDGINS